MHNIFRIRFGSCFADNLKSKIENRKLAGVLAFALVLLLRGAGAEAQQPKKIWRMGYLSSVNPVNESARAEGIRLALHEQGYIEGQDIAIEYRYAEGKLDRGPELAAELVRLKVDIIVVAGGIRWIHISSATVHGRKPLPEFCS